MSLTKQQLLVIIVILAAVAVVSIGVTVWAVFFRDSEESLPPDYPPQDTEENQKPLEEDSTSTGESFQSPPGGGAISITYSPAVTVDLSERAVFLLYANPSASNQNVSIQLTIDGVVIASSQLITPGHGVDRLALDASAAERLRAGGYDGEIVVRAYHPETGEKAMVDTKGQITVTVRN